MDRVIPAGTDGGLPEKDLLPHPIGRVFALLGTDCDVAAVVAELADAGFERDQIHVAAGLQRGGSVISVPVTRQTKCFAASILQAHGGHAIRFFGLLMIERLN